MNELIRIILDALLEETELDEEEAIEYAQVAASAIVANGWPRKVAE